MFSQVYTLVRNLPISSAYSTFFILDSTSFQSVLTPAQFDQLDPLTVRRTANLKISGGSLLADSKGTGFGAKKRIAPGKGIHTKVASELILHKLSIFFQRFSMTNNNLHS